MIGVGQHVGQMVLRPPGHFDYRLQTRMRRPEIPARPETLRPYFSLVRPQDTQAFLDRPRPSRLQLRGFQFSEPGPMTLRHICLGMEPKVFLPSQRFVPFSAQPPMLTTTDLID